jgi:DNA-binding response OmpR family regulator
MGSSAANVAGSPSFDVASSVSATLQRIGQQAVGGGIAMPSIQPAVHEANRGPETMRIIIIEDNPMAANAARSALEDSRFEVDIAHDGIEGEAMAASGTYDLIILDLMLPDRDGVDICRALRRHGINTPILMLTSLSSTDDKVIGLRAGADDYLTKPFEGAELLARVEAIARRTSGGDSTRLQFSGIEMDLLKRQVTRDGRPINLTAKEFALLECFLRSPHRVLSKTQLGSRVWEQDFEQESNVIEVYISRLRKKIDQAFEKQLLRTVVGSGYMLTDEASATDA